ncbi:unnamed protein product, partial [Rhizoctonia solani]
MTTGAAPSRILNDLSESPAEAPGIPMVVEDMDAESSLTRLSSEDTPESHRTSNPEPAGVVLNPGQKGRNTAWNGLRGALRLLKDSSNVFPQLSSAVESLLSCLDGLEVIVQNRRDFEDLATELTTLTYDAGHRAIERQVMEIREKLDQERGGGIRGATIDDEVLVRHYRQIQSHFRQLQIDASMSIWSIANEHLVNTRLEGLNPAKKATYDSSLSTEVSRRACTEGTRIRVLDGLDNWLDSSMKSIYWMNGMAGTGKTTIASTF